jgi:FAD/FMN-containing dehydrogenase
MIAANAAVPVLVNDVHSKLNATQVREVFRPQSLAQLQEFVRGCARDGRNISVSGGRHAMGGQQFASNCSLIDTRPLNQVLHFDRAGGTVEVEAGIQWPELVRYLVEVQEGEREQWGIAQKQTGADRLTIGGALSANVHGRGLRMKPFVADVESFTVVNADGELQTCSRRSNPELFRLAIGGYGVFGVIYSVKLHLTRRRKLRRVVKVIDVDDLPAMFERRIREGFLYGDFQFAIDAKSEDFLKKGVFSCYEPVAQETPMPETSRQMDEKDWSQLVHLAHVDKSRAFEHYASHYLATDGQVYWSDLHQLSVYVDGYHEAVSHRCGSAGASEMITELYVPRAALPGFMASAAKALREEKASVIYGTVRLIEKDEETFLPWAKESYACVIFNLHVEHTALGLLDAARSFRRLIDIALSFGGSFYLTYHRWATAEQVAAAYPQFEQFLRSKRAHDPEERFVSDWYRHYKMLFAQRQRARQGTRGEQLVSLRTRKLERAAVAL